MDSDDDVPPLLNVACRFLPHDQWFTTHVDPEWKVRQVKSWLLAKCLPYAAPPSPPLRHTNKKPQRPPSPITFAPDPRHRPISPITFAAPKTQATEDDVSELEELALEPSVADSESEIQEEVILPAVQARRRAVLPDASTSSKGDLYAQYTLIRFSTGQLLEDDLPLGFYDLQADELLELHRLGVVIPLPRSNLTRYLDAYWEGWVRLLRAKPGEEEDDNYGLYRIRHLENRPLDWKDRWVVVREGHLHIYRDPNHQPITRLSLNDLHALHNSSQLPSSAPSSSSNNDRILLARFSTQPASNLPTRASSPLSPIPSDSSSPLSSPVFAHDSDDSGRPRRQRPPQRKRRKRDPEFLVIDLKDDSTYVSLLRVLHRHSMPTSTFVDSLPVGSDQLDSPAHGPTDDDADDDAHMLRHPPSLTMLRVSRGLGVLPFPEWRTDLLRKAQRAGLGRIGRALAWLRANEDFLYNDDDAFWLHESPVRRRKRRSKADPKGKGKARRPTSTDGYDSDLSASYSELSEDDDDDDNDSLSGDKSETEWVGWMGDLRRQKRVAREAEEEASRRKEARRIAEETRDAELGLPQMPLSAGAEITISRVGTGVDDRTRRAAMEPSAVVTSLSGVNPPVRNLHGHLAHPGSAHSSSSRMTPVLSSPSSNESFGTFAFSPLAAPAELDEEIPPTQVGGHHRTHSRTHSHTLLHSVSLYDTHVLAESQGEALRRPSMPVIGSSGSVWGAGSRPSSLEREMGDGTSGSTRVGTISSIPSTSTITTIITAGNSNTSTTGIIEVARPPLVRAESTTSNGRGLLRKQIKDGDRPKLSLSTKSSGTMAGTAMSPPGTPIVTHAEPPPPVPKDKDKKKKRGIARGVSLRAEKLVKSLDSALDFVDGR